jgi:hypothetical protein
MNAGRAANNTTCITYIGGEDMKKSTNADDRLERAKAKDSTDEGRSEFFMTKDAWNQDGNPAAIVDEFGPELEREAPPTLNGKPAE